MNHQYSDKILRAQGLTSSDISTAQEENVKRMLLSVYHRYWDLSLEARAIILDGLIITVGEETSAARHYQAYHEGFAYVAHKLFPAAQQNAQEEFALALLKAYLDTANVYECQFLLAGILAASNSASHHTVGGKLASLLEHLGPAYVKLAQAIHSHPDTPEQLKSDLSHVKGMANPPYRWDLMCWIETVVPRTLRERIVHVGDLLGSASYHLAVEITMKSGEKRVLLLLRKHAKEEAAKGFAHLKRALDHCQHQQIQHSRETYKSIISEAEQASHAELSQEIGDLQNQKAHGLYATKPKIKVEVGKLSYRVHFTVCNTIESGSHYRVLSLMKGIEFNQLPKTTAKDYAIRKAIAMAVLEQELGLILSGREFDCDRHGGQLKVDVQEQRIYLGLYDFGEMCLELPTPQEIHLMAALVNELPAVVEKGSGEINNLFQRHIVQARHRNEPHRYLMRANKALLALQDFQQWLDFKELKEVILRARARMHPEICKALEKGALQQMNKYERFSLYLANGLSFFRRDMDESDDDTEQSDETHASKILRLD